VCPIPDACLLVMAQRPYRLLGLPETRSLIFLIKNSPDQAEGYLDYLQPPYVNPLTVVHQSILRRLSRKHKLRDEEISSLTATKMHDLFEEDCVITSPTMFI
jgi:hypothetical protein